MLVKHASQAIFNGHKVVDSNHGLGYLVKTSANQAVGLDHDKIASMEKLSDLLVTLAGFRALVLYESPKTLRSKLKIGTKTKLMTK